MRQTTNSMDKKLSPSQKKKMNDPEVVGDENMPEEEFKEGDFGAAAAGVAGDNPNLVDIEKKEMSAGEILKKKFEEEDQMTPE